MPLSGEPPRLSWDQTEGPEHEANYFRHVYSP